MLIHQRDRLLAAWYEGFVTDGQISDWADKQLLRVADLSSIPSWLLSLVENGPAACVELPDFAWPAPLGYVSGFSLRAASLDIGNDVDVVRFAEWSAYNCIGEDIDLPEVQLGYHLEHFVCDCQRLDWAIVQVRKDLPPLLEVSR